INPDPNRETKEPQHQAAPIIDRAPLPIVEVQGSAHMLSFVNAAFCRLVGKTKAELIGKQFAEIVPGGTDCVPILNKVYETGEGTTLAHEVNSEQSPAYWLYAMWPALDTHERPAGVIIQLTRAIPSRLNAVAINEALLVSGLRQHELTEKADKLNEQLKMEIGIRRIAEASLVEAKDRLSEQAGQLERLVEERTERLREIVEELEAFSYSVAHDLRAPLRAIQGYSSNLLEGYSDRLDETGLNYLQRMERAAIRMDQLIRDVLSYTKVVREELPMRAVGLDLLLHDLIDTYPQWQPPRAEVRIDGKLPDVFANDALLGQCISNLVDNAVKFVAPGTTPRVKVWAQVEKSRVRVWIEDNGLGIAPADRSRVFRMFERIHPSNEFSGTGIGLTIVRKAIERMNGEVGFESELGQGSRFWIELPEVRTA
ncbi:MAG TPA: ATP-binding protein, partial [Verrucomicrobiae bacterium]|nr:ATP-binding protein [Verrucomicrobiae bacterium]